MLPALSLETPPPQTVAPLQSRIGNQAALRILNKPSTPPASGAVQRVTRIGKKYVLPDKYSELAAFVQKVVVEVLDTPWSPELKALLETWLDSREYRYEFGDLQHLIQRLLDGEGELTSAEKVPIPPDELKAGQQRRHLERFGTLLEPYQVQTPSTVPGMAKIPNQELLRLANIGDEEQEYWVRPSKEDLALFKRRGISKEDEHRVIATGDPDDPSYIVWQADASYPRQRGHRYKAGGGTNDSKNRTYGSKHDRDGIVYKISGAVDGHSVQAQDNQLTLGPFKADALHWTTTIITTDGSTITHKDSEYLPTDETSEIRIEVHPYNMYWENQQQGKAMRQKSIEAPALKNKTSFLHYNDYRGGVTANPNNEKVETHVYPVPDTIHYLICTDKGVAHHIADNRLVADYSNPVKYDKKTNKYPDISGAPEHQKNKNLGGESAYTHLDWSKQADTKGYPTASVLETSDDKFEFLPKWRKDTTLVPGYQSPPGSPFHIPAYMEEEDKTISGHHYRGEILDGMLVNKSTYDKPTKKSKVKVTRIPRADFDQLKKALDLEKFKQSYKRKHVEEAVTAPDSDEPAKKKLKTAPTQPAQQPAQQPPQQQFPQQQFPQQQFPQQQFPQQQFPQGMLPWG